MDELLKNTLYEKGKIHKEAMSDKSFLVLFVWDESLIFLDICLQILVFDRRKRIPGCSRVGKIHIRLSEHKVRNTSFLLRTI